MYKINESANQYLIATTGHTTFWSLYMTGANHLLEIQFEFVVMPKDIQLARRIRGERA